MHPKWVFNVPIPQHVSIHTMKWQFEILQLKHETWHFLPVWVPPENSQIFDFCLMRLIIPSLNAMAVLASNRISFWPPTKESIILGASNFQFCVISFWILFIVSSFLEGSGRATRANRESEDTGLISSDGAMELILMAVSMVSLRTPFWWVVFWTLCPCSELLPMLCGMTPYFLVMKFKCPSTFCSMTDVWDW